MFKLHLNAVQANDAELPLRQFFEAILNGTDGFNCTGSFSSANNLRLDIEKSTPDVILMDIEMDRMNGIDAIKAINRFTPI